MALPLFDDPPTYRLSNRHASSARLGPCEVCHEHCTEVWMQVELRGKVEVGDAFGHKACLETLRV